MMKLILVLTALLNVVLADPKPRLRAAHVVLTHSVEKVRAEPEPAAPAVQVVNSTAAAPASTPLVQVVNMSAAKPVTAVHVADVAADLDDDADDDLADASDEHPMTASANATEAAEDASDEHPMTSSPKVNATKAAVVDLAKSQDEEAEEAEESEGEHEEEEHDPATKSGFDLDTIEQSLAKLGNKKKAAATPGMIKFVNMTKGMIKDDMKPKIMDAHKKDQELLNSYKRGFNKCWRGRKTSKAAMVSLKVTKRKSSSSHKSCRKVEAKTFKKKQVCDDLLDAKKETRKAACSAFKDLSRNPNTEADNCHAARKEKFEEWLDRNQAWFVSKNKEYKFHKAKCYGAKKAVKDFSPYCKVNTTIYVKTKSSCDLKQDQLEEATCNLGKKMWQTCDAYDRCYDANKRAYKKAKPGIKKQEKDRKGEWRVLMRVECLLDVFASDDGEVDDEVIGKCKNKTHDTTHLDLAYPPIPPKQACAPIPAVPGSTEFKQAEYSALPENADAKIPSTCVVSAGAGIELGAPKGVPSSKCTMVGSYLKASQRGSCMLSNVDGKPIKVDYTKNRFTTYSFVMKFDGNAGNFNRMPVGGFKVCNTDRKRYTRGRSPEFNFYDIRGYWGYTFVRHPHTYSRYQNRKSWPNRKAYPKNGKDVHWEITMEYRGNRRLYVYSWKVNGVQLRAYNNYITNCWNHGKHHAFTPRIWAWGATKGVYISDFKVYQGLVNTDMIQIVGTGIPKTPYTVPCAVKGKRYRGRGIPGYGRSRAKNVLNCQKRCAYLSGCETFMYKPDGWCYYYQAGARASKAPRSYLTGPPVCDSPYKTGLKADFFFYKGAIRRLPNLAYAKPSQTRTDLTVWYAQTGGHWAGIKRRNRYASRWTGSILIKQGGAYRFDVTSDDGSFLWIDGRVVVNNPGLHGPRTVYQWVRLNAGYHDIMLTHFENLGGSNMYFRYYGPDTMYHHWVVPTEVLRPADKNQGKRTGPFATPNNKKYYRYIDQSALHKKGDLTYVLATVRAKNDAHIGLFPEEVKDPVNQGGAFYEFVIGGWGAQRSAIRRKRAEHPRTFPYTRNIVSKYEWRDFWVSFDKKTGVAAAGRGHTLGKYKFMEWKDSSPMDIKSVAVMTGWGGTGEWYFVNKKMENPKKKPLKWGKSGWFLGEQGDDCTMTCANQGRTCDENLRKGFSYNDFRMTIRSEMGVTCEKDKRRWWAHDQPCYVSGGKDSNQNKCLAYSNLPTKVRCSGKHPKVMRYCKCSPTAMVPHLQKQNSKYITWAEYKKIAKSKGGRLMTKAEARLFLRKYKRGVIFSGKDVWCATEEKNGDKDWVQIGNRYHRPGTSHVEKYRYPNWGDNKGYQPRYRNTQFNWMIWATDRR